jgi:hypothetical protein
LCKDQRSYFITKEKNYEEYEDFFDLPMTFFVLSDIIKKYRDKKAANFK